MGFNIDIDKLVVIEDRSIPSIHFLTVSGQLRELHWKKKKKNK